MGESTSIGWCDATFNPWWGCERVSPGCAHCYADTFAIRLGMPTLWRPNPLEVKEIRDRGHDFRFFGAKHWDEPLKWARLAREGRLPDGTENLDGHRPRIFCASMADVFEERVELEEHRIRLFNLILATPELDWLVLTKRPVFARDWILAGSGFGFSEHDNLWMGVSIENARFTWRADVLREIPAAVRFISAEPLLSSLHPVLPTGADWRNPAFIAPWVDRRRPLDLTGIDWIIIGGESGPKARPFHIEHAREIVQAAQRVCDDCWEDGLTYDAPPHIVECKFRPAVFVKQLGRFPIFETPRADAPHLAPMVEAWPITDGKGEEWSEWPADLRIREWPRSAA